ncbi:hypothetical protein AOLI_G00113150 [Acnodon oligacanthus]
MGIPHLGTAQTPGDKTRGGGCDLPAIGRRRQGRQFVSERSSTLAGLSASFYGGPIRRLTWLMLIAAGAARP